MSIRHRLTNLQHEWQEDHRADGVRDERRGNGDDKAEYQDDGVGGKAGNPVLDHDPDRLQQPRRLHALPQGGSTHSQHDDAPQKVVKVVLVQDARPKVRDDGENGEDAHLADKGLEGLGEAEEEDGQDGDGGDEPLGATLLRVSSLLACSVKDIDVSVADREDKEEDEPGGEGAGNGSGKGGEHPGEEADGIVPQDGIADNVLGGRDGGDEAADIPGICDAEDQCLGQGVIKGEGAEDWVEEAKGEDRGGNVANEDGCQGAEDHVDEDDPPGLLGGALEDGLGDGLCHAVLAQGSGHRESTEEEHDVVGEEALEDLLSCLPRAQDLPRRLALHPEDDGEGGEEHAGGVEGKRLGAPEDDQTDDHGGTVVGGALGENGKDKGEEEEGAKGEGEGDRLLPPDLGVMSGMGGFGSGCRCGLHGDGLALGLDHFLPHRCALKGESLTETGAEVLDGQVAIGARMQANPEVLAGRNVPPQHLHIGHFELAGEEQVTEALGTGNVARGALVSVDDAVKAVPVHLQKVSQVIEGRVDALQGLLAMLDDALVCVLEGGGYGTGGDVCTAAIQGVRKFLALLKVKGGNGCHVRSESLVKVILQDRGLVAGRLEGIPLGKCLVALLGGHTGILQALLLEAQTLQGVEGLFEGGIMEVVVAPLGDTVKGQGVSETHGWGRWRWM